jgi:hypothetical protein
VRGLKKLAGLFMNNTTMNSRYIHLIITNEEEVVGVEILKVSTFLRNF